jgi:hypothetical protein
MKSMTPTWFGALLMATAGLVYCGGSDSPLTTPSGSGGATSGGSGGRTAVTGVTGAGTTTSGTTGAGGGTGTTTSVTTGTTTAATTTGGAGGAATGGAGGNPTGGTGGAIVDAGLCPAMQPMQFAVCTSSGEVCNYPGFACTCTAGMGRGDAGQRLGWNCMRVGGFDAGLCPQVAPVTGMFCMGVGNVCVYPTETCTCQAGGMMMGNRWNCL